MRALLIAPAVSLALLAAHFARDARWLPAIACVALVALLALRRPWVPRLAQFALAAGCLEWAWTTFGLVQQRIALDRPWGRMALILSAVILLTALSAAVFRHSAIRARYARPAGPGEGKR